MSYGNGRTLSLNYDNRLRPTQYDIPGVLRLQYEYGWENTARVGFVRNIDDQTLDRWFVYDHVGRLIVSRSGTEARIGFGEQIPVAYDGPYSQGYEYDVWGNRTHIEGWGGVARWEDPTYTNNRRNGMQYDAAGNGVDGNWFTFSFDAASRQTRAAAPGYTLDMAYDGDGVRAKKTENGDTTYYLRSSVLGGQVVAEIYGGGVSYPGSIFWSRGYVYIGEQMVALQQNGVFWTHQEPVGKSQRVTDTSGNVVNTIELDPFGGDTGRSSSNQAFQPHRFTSYERDGNGADDAMFRRYNRWWAAFDQPDPYDGSYNLTDPQSFNRYAYVQNDPVNFVDPSGLMTCGAEYSYSDCGGGGGFWGGAGGFGGHVADYNERYGGLTPNVAAGMRLHNQRVQNNIGGYGFLTNAEVTRIHAGSYIVDLETGQLVWAGGDSWSVDTPWHEYGILNEIGIGARGFADELTMGFVSWVERKQGRLSPAEEEWLANSNVHNAGGWAGVAGGLVIPGPGKLTATKTALSQVHKIVGKLPKSAPGKFGGPQRGTSIKGYRLDPGHPNARPGSPEAGPHINWWDYTRGKRGRGGRSGAIPIR